MRPVVTIVVVDDHSLFAQALENLINSFGEFKVLYHVKNGQEFVKKLAHIENVPDLAVIDINMPVMDGVETTRWLKKNYPTVNVIALSMDDDEPTIIRMLRAGARGYLLKDISPTILHDAFKDVIDKGFYYSNCITNHVLTSLHRGKEADHELKDREVEFLKLACTEMTYKEIAGAMCLSPKTIDGYRESLFEKLQIKSRVGLVIYAIKNKIYKPE
ncbi:response regulator transcription factor [Chryseosolibacter indicus]|uniref:Response regulator transcription factor n=1 Tax=Chryseosolibacter indicus TaxID=2782351 RepID=A0ABS5VSS5_9BACT|nr:response regulator transcription factor [Chryseosolibacter indicus]MBT1704490.1 response regulator transcription factor [Chryseosolibacter indicus]